MQPEVNSAEHVAGVSVAKTVKIADWRRKSTFRRYYQKLLYPS